MAPLLLASRACRALRCRKQKHALPVEQARKEAGHKVEQQEQAQDLARQLPQPPVSGRLCWSFASMRDNITKFTQVAAPDRANTRRSARFLPDRILHSIRETYRLILQL